MPGTNPSSPYSQVDIMNKPTDRPPRRSTGPNAKQRFRIPHPLEDLKGVRLSTKPIPQSVYDRIMKRDARIFERLAKV